MILCKREQSGLKHIDTSLELVRSLNAEKEIKLIKVNAINIAVPAILVKKEHDFCISAKKGISIEQLNNRKKINKLLATWNRSEFIMERIFTIARFPESFEAEVSVIKNRHFSSKRKLYQRLIIPVSDKVSFFSILEQRNFRTPTLHSSECIRANFENYFLDLYLYKDKKKNNYLIIDCSAKLPHEEFSDVAFACLVTLGYVTGKLVQNEGVYFCYTSREMKMPFGIKFSSFRPSINSLHHPVNANPYGFKVKGKKGDKLYKKLMLITEQEFSKLCIKIYTKTDLRAAILMMMEALKGSVFTIATGMAVVLETLTNLYAKENPDYFIHIKQPKVAKAILKELRAVITSHKAEIGATESKLIDHVNRINQVPNITKLTKSFEMLGFKLNEDDIKVIGRRNDLLHGRLSLDYGIEIDKADRELYLIATKLYTLINVLILKQIGFSGYIVNWPVYNKHVHKYKLKEEVFRKI